MNRLAPMLALVAALAAVLPAAAQGLEDAARLARSGDHAGAAKAYARLAEQGSAAAQVQLGLAYLHGQGVPESDARAFEWFSRAAAQGDIDGMYHLGNLYVFGWGLPERTVEQDQSAAQFYFEAARRGHAGAQYGLGILLLTGKGVQADRDEAMKWIGRAARQGHADAQRFVVDEPPKRP